MKTLKNCIEHWKLVFFFFKRGLMCRSLLLKKNMGKKSVTVLPRKKRRGEDKKKAWKFYESQQFSFGRSFGVSLINMIGRWYVLKWFFLESYWKRFFNLFIVMSRKKIFLLFRLSDLNVNIVKLQVVSLQNASQSVI